MEGISLTAALGYFCIIACIPCKLPQIKNVYQTRNVEGVSVSSILMELLCHGVQAGFYVSESYPLLEYLEYPFLVLQNFVLLFLIGVVTNSLSQSLKYISVYTLIISIVAGGFFSKSTILTVMSLNIPIGVSSKLAQVSAIRSVGTSDNVSYFAWVVNLLTGGARLYTHLLSRGETLVLLNFSVMLFANAAVIFTIFLFRGNKAKQS